MAVFGSIYVDVRLTSACLIALIAFTIGFELLTHVIDKKIRNSPEISNVVSKLYKELMILGFISFIIFIVESSNSNSGAAVYGIKYDNHANSTTEAGGIKYDDSAGGGGGGDNFYKLFINLEFAHILIFFVALFFVIQASISIRISQLRRKVWDRCESRSPSDILEDFFLFQKKKKDLKEMHKGGIVADRKNNLRRDELIPEMKFHVLRSYFLQTHIIPHDIDFPMYLSESLSTYLIQLVEVDISSWTCLVFLLGLAAIIWPDSSGGDSGSYALFFEASIAFGWVLFGLNVGMYVAAQRAMTKLLALAEVRDEEDDLPARLEMVVRETVQVQELQARVTQTGWGNKKVRY
jgi:hypothetical protein